MSNRFLLITWGWGTSSSNRIAEKVSIFTRSNSRRGGQVPTLVTTWVIAIALAAYGCIRALIREAEVFGRQFFARSVRKVTFLEWATSPDKCLAFFMICEAGLVVYSSHKIKGNQRTPIANTDHGAISPCLMVITERGHWNLVLSIFFVIPCYSRTSDFLY